MTELDLDELEQFIKNHSSPLGILTIESADVLELIRRLREAERKIESLEQDIREYVDAQPPI